MDHSPLIEHGDRLSPAKITAGLKASVFGRTIHVAASLVSTMDRAAELALSGCPEGTVVAAETQTQGRGRQGRVWVSPVFAGLYFSFVLRPGEEQSRLVTLMTAVAVCAAVREKCPVDARIKWPNDIMIGLNKVAGILTERRASAGPGAIITGVGINVNGAAGQPCPGAVYLSAACGRPVDRNSLLSAILGKLDGYYISLKSGPDAILETWRSLNCTLGARVRWESGKKRMEGTALAIDADGCLLIRSDTGLTVRAASGTLSHLPAGGTQ